MELKTVNCFPMKISTASKALYYHNFAILEIETLWEKKTIWSNCSPYHQCQPSWGDSTCTVLPSGIYSFMQCDHFTENIGVLYLCHSYIPTLQSQDVKLTFFSGSHLAPKINIFSGSQFQKVGGHYDTHTNSFYPATVLDRLSCS